MICCSLNWLEECMRTQQSSYLTFLCSPTIFFFNIKMRVLNRFKCIYKRCFHSWFLSEQCIFTLLCVMLRVFSCRIIFVVAHCFYKQFCCFFGFGAWILCELHSAIMHNAHIFGISSICHKLLVNMKSMHAGFRWCIQIWHDCTYHLHSKDVSNRMIQWIYVFKLSHRAASTEINGWISLCIAHMPHTHIYHPK